MTELERNLILKLGLWLQILEGWVPTVTAVNKMGGDSASVGAALGWLGSQGYIDGSGNVVRWLQPARFEDLWEQLIPGRPCPIAPLRVTKQRVDH